MRSQFTSLNADIQQQAMNTGLTCAIAKALAQTSNNGNGVGTLGQGADIIPNQEQMQDGLNKLDELINALRRWPEDSEALNNSRRKDVQCCVPCLP